MSEPSADDVLLAELADSFVKRYQRGERPSIDAYVAAHPQLGDRIRDLFPAMVLVEELGPDVSEVRAPADSPLQPAPVQLGDYRVIREIGRGGMGVVYEAEQLSLRRRVALKLMNRRGSDDRAVKRFEREAQATARLQHANIVPVYEVGVEQDTRFFAMQFVQGQGLDAVIAELRQLRRETDQNRLQDASSADPRSAPTMLAISLMNGLPPESDAQAAAKAQVPEAQVPEARPADGSTGRVALDDTGEQSAWPAAPGSSDRIVGGPAYYQSVGRIGLQVARALAYAHQAGVLHRDVKPSNLLLDHRANVWVADFGLAKTEDGDLTRTGDVVGTLSYLAPECFHGAFDVRSDVYALGITLYELATLRPVYRGEDRLEIVRKITESDPQRPRSLDPSIPRDLETVILKAIAREPSHRYQTADELADDLERFLEDRSILARRTSLPERIWRSVRRNPRLSTMGLVIVLLLLATGLLIARHLNPGDPAAATPPPKVVVAKPVVGVRPSIMQGDQRQQQRDYFAALLWYADALRETEQHGRDPGNDRMRIAELLRKSPRLLHRFHADDNGRSFSYNPRGTHLLSYPAAGTSPESFPVVLWDLRTGESIQVLDQVASVGQMHFTPDGRSLVIIVNDGEMHLLSAMDGTPRMASQQMGAGAWAYISPNGSAMTVRSRTRCLIIDLAACKITTEVNDRWVRRAAFSEDDQYLAMATNPLPGDARIARSIMSLTSQATYESLSVWDVGSGRELRNWPYHKRLGTLRVVPDGPCVLAQDDQGIRFGNASTGQLLATLPHRRGAAINVFDQGRALLDLKAHGEGQLWDLESPQREPESIQLGQGGMLDCYFVAEGSRLAAVNRLQARVSISDRTSGEMLWVSRGTSSRFSTPPAPSEKFALSALSDTTLQVVDLQRATISKQKLEHSAAVRCASFSDDLMRLVTGCEDGTVRVWDTVSGELLGAWLRHARPIRQATLLPDDRVLSRDDIGEVRLWQLPRNAGNEVAPLLNGQTVLSFDAKFAAVVLGQLVEVWDLSLRERIAKRKFNSHVVRVQFSLGGDRLLVAMRSGHANDWAFRDELPGAADIPLDHSRPISAAAFSRDNGRLATAANNEVYVWELPSGRRIAGPLVCQGLICRLGFGPSGRRLFASPDTGGRQRANASARVWDVHSGALLQSVVARGPARTTIGSAALSPDGQWLVVGHAGGEPGPISADLFKIGNPKPAVRLQHRDAVCDVAFDPSSARVATASWDGTARVWSVAGGKPLTPPLRHRGAVNAVRFSPDGRRVLTGGQSGEVQLWDATSGESIAKFEHRLAVVEVAFDAVGGAIVSRAKDGSLRRWTVPLETRDVALLRELAEGWSGLQIDPIGGLVPVDPGASRLSE